MRIILFLIAAVLLSCNREKILEKYKSPTGDYILQVELDDSKSNDEHLGFRLMNKNGAESDYVRTLSNDYMKWTVLWYNDTTIILNSRDVGIYGWTIDKKGRFETIDPMLFRDIEDKCDEALNSKYGTHKSH